MAAAAVFAQMASAELTYNILQADVVFGNGDTDNLNVVQDGGELDFSANNWPLLVGDGASADGHNYAVITIVYTVESDQLITGLELIFSGWAVNYGAIGYTEYVENWDPDSGFAGPELASVEGSFYGSGLGGSDDPFTQTDLLSFNEGVFSYKVKKTFTLAIFDQENPHLSLASIGLIEQNAVPEPATMGALAIGALGLLARRRRK